MLSVDLEEVKVVFVQICSCVFSECNGLLYPHVNEIICMVSPARQW